jgi:23S rRNA (cytidine1920-2'-O)/16S rRNA (cytidine1409-2'-O)-methyltransferase
MNKKRIDLLLVGFGLAESRSKAQRMIMAGEVTVDGRQVFKPSEKFDLNSAISVKSKPLYVSRGGIKLAKAIETFKIDNISEKICVDIGSSTGGFTDCLLKHGAPKVYAVDVGYGQLHYALRNDKRVVVMEKVNVKDIDVFPEMIDLVTVDVSFISLKRIFPVIKKWKFRKMLEAIILIKPQFEVGRKIAAKAKGVIRNEKNRWEAVKDVLSSAGREGFKVAGLIESPIKGSKGNVEFLSLLHFSQ